jgi:hypothetical protein
MNPHRVAQHQHPILISNGWFKLGGFPRRNLDGRQVLALGGATSEGSGRRWLSLTVNPGGDAALAEGTTAATRGAPRKLVVLSCGRKAGVVLMLAGSSL